MPEAWDLRRSAVSLTVNFGVWSSSSCSTKEVTERMADEFKVAATSDRTSPILKASANMVAKSMSYYVQ